VLDHAMPAYADIQYRLVGTGAALLHGVELPAGDVDVVVKNREDVDVFGAALSPFGCLSPPTWLQVTRQYYANYEVNGVEVGFSTVEIESEADTIETFGRGPWEHFVLIPCGPYAVPTVALELRLATELLRDRPDRYRPIIRHMRANGCDSDLLRRALGCDRPDAPALPQAVQEDVLRQLEGASELRDRCGSL
jgi:hypothetical protein